MLHSSEMSLGKAEIVIIPIKGERINQRGH